MRSSWWCATASVELYITAVMCAGCFSRAALPDANFIENRRAWDAVSSVDERTLELHLRHSFYQHWIAEYGDSLIPPTVDAKAPIDATGMALAEGPVSALLLAQLTPDKLAEIEPMLSTEQYVALVEAAYLYRKPITRRIERVGARVAEAAGHSDIEFVLAPIGLNAAVPQVFDARKVLVGPQLALLLMDDSELAAVLAHEVAHITEGHAAAGATWNVAITTLQIAVAIAVLAADAGGQSQYGYDSAISEQRALAAANLTGLAVRGALTASGYTRDQERDADYFGLEFASKAGFEPVGALAAFFKLGMIEKGTGSAPEIPYFTDHPGTDERIVRITKQVGRLKGGDFSGGGLHCWHAPTNAGVCTTCCTSTSYCVSEIESD